MNRQYLGSVGKVDNGIVAVTRLWTSERCYWPVHAVPYIPASRLPGGDRDPASWTKPQLALELVAAARTAKIGFQAVVADCSYGDNPGFTDALLAACSLAAGIPTGTCGWWWWPPPTPAACRGTAAGIC